MDYKKLVKQRRSIRKYKDKDVSEEKVQKIINYALHAPSSCNTQSWRFVIVRDQSIKDKLSEVQPYCSFIKEAPVTIIAGSDSSQCNYNPSGLLSVAAAVENLLLGIENEGLGACWTYVKDHDEPKIEQDVKQILNIPEEIDLIAMIPLGYPDEKPAPKKVHDFDRVAHKDKWE